MNDSHSLPAVASLLATAQETAVLAGNLAIEKQNQPLQVENKGYRDLVTDADFAVQKLITDTIGDRFPRHGFLTEEESDSPLSTDGPVIWIVDPIDGTTNYSRHIPVFCISIAAVAANDAIQKLRNGTPDRYPHYDVLAGVIYDPVRQEMFSALAGQEATLNERPIEASAVTELKEAVVGLDWSHSRELRQSAVDAVNRLAHHVHSVRAVGSAALAMAWVAAGRLDGYLNYHLKPWDVAAASLLIQEAGGTISNGQGRPAQWSMGGSHCVASNGRLHRALLSAITGP